MSSDEYTDPCVLLDGVPLAIGMDMLGLEKDISPYSSLVDRMG
jgi:hypothetical protein